MNYSMLLFRILHISLGVFWAGALIFNAAFLLPAVRDAAPESGKVVAALIRRRFLDITPLAALLTILSGLWLYWTVSIGFSPEYMRSTKGMTYGFGAACAIIAFALGVGIMRPSILKAVQLSQSAASANESDRAAILQSAQMLRVRAGKAGIIVAWLLGFTVIAMAIGRYV
jgi:uncharacterized membrane protein